MESKLLRKAAAMRPDDPDRLPTLQAAIVATLPPWRNDPYKVPKPSDHAKSIATDLARRLPDVDVRADGRWVTVVAPDMTSMQDAHDMFKLLVRRNQPAGISARGVDYRDVDRHSKGLVWKVFFEDAPEGPRNQPSSTGYFE